MLLKGSREMGIPGREIEAAETMVRDIAAVARDQSHVVIVQANT
jgi:hypothetical protein